MISIIRVSYALVVCASIWLLSSCQTTPQDKATAIATAAYPGKGKIDQCDVYANSLLQALKENNIQAWKICYLNGNWEKSYLHALVVYKDAGSYWYTDNMFPFPTKAWGTTPRQWAQDRDPSFIVVTKVVFNDVGFPTLKPADPQQPSR